ncbi:MAG: hypothetical protein EBZ13_06725 [Planctomycetia bacterium]|nr:hypothetical protein [Planctomycetia bacterium]
MSSRSLTATRLVNKAAVSCREPGSSKRKAKLRIRGATSGLLILSSSMASSVIPAAAFPARLLRVARQASKIW